MKLTADIAARALLASATVYGDDPTLWAGRAKKVHIRAATAAASALAREFNLSHPRAGRMFGLGESSVGAARIKNRGDFARAEAAALDAIRYARRMDELQARAAGAAKLTSNVVPMARPQPAPAKPRGRQFPRSARFESLGDGVSVVRLKPITDAVLAHARAQVDRGLSIGEAAEFFDIDEDLLRQRLTEGVRA